MSMRGPEGAGSMREGIKLLALSRLRHVGMLMVVFAMIWAIPAGAQDYPARPITLVNSSTPGGGGDLIARIISGPLTRDLGQPVVILNRTGGAGLIAMETVARAAPDGHTLLIGFTGHVISPGLFKAMPVDSVRDFTPISFIATNLTVALARSSLPAKSIKELIELARASPGKLTMGYYSGTSQHLAGELFNTMAKINVLGVPYKGSQEALTDLIGGRTDYIFSTYSTAQPAVSAGTARILGVTDVTRSQFLPDVPTIAEGGVPGYSSRGWYGLLGPAGMPKVAVSKLNAALLKMLQTEEVRQRLITAGSEPLGSSPEQFAEFIRTEIPRWSKVIRDAGITPQ